MKVLTRVLAAFGVLVVVLVLVLIVAAPAAAQNREFAVGGIFSAPSSMGKADAQLLGSNGQPSVTLFSTENSMSAGFGPEIVLGYRLGKSKKTWIEAAGGVTWPKLTSRITNDFEKAADVTLSAPVTRWSVEGAVVFWLHDSGGTGWFVRAGGGVAGEVSGDLSSSATGAVGTGGVGLRHWFRNNGKGAIKRLGVRAEFRGVVQGGGLSLSDRTIRFAPTGTVHLVFGY